MALLALTAMPVSAGDRAGIEFLGYSPDSRYFAFAELGIQDGSGLAYANVHFLDLSTDRWVEGTPIRARTEDEGKTLPVMRAEALSQAQGLIAQYEIGEPVDLLALNADGAVDADYASLTFGTPGYALSAPGNVATVTLESFAAEGDPACATYMDEAILGLAISVEQNGTSNEVHRDIRVPTSRGCTQAYRLYGVVAPFDSFAAFSTNPMGAAVAIVSVYTLGFEGPDRRFIAVPLGN